MDVFLVFSGMYVDPKLYIPDDAVATVSNILASEWLFRLGFVSNQVGQILFLFLVFALYDLFKSVDKGQFRLFGCPHQHKGIPPVVDPPMIRRLWAKGT